MHEWLRRPEESVGPLRAGVTGGWEINMGAGN